MRRFLTASALFALGLVTAAASGQPQPEAPPKAKTEDKGAPSKPTAPKYDPTDAAIASALAHDPDVKMALAKIQLAEAELAKARQAITLKVVTLKAKLDQLRTDVRGAEERVVWAARMVEKGMFNQAQLLTERDKLEAVKAALAAAEVEWKLLTGAAPGAPGAGNDGGAAWLSLAAGVRDDETVSRALLWLATQPGGGDDLAVWRAFRALVLARERTAVKGPISDRIRAALDKPVKLGAKGEKVTFAKALEVFKKEVGLDVPVRGTFPERPAVDPKKPNEVQTHPIEIVSEGEELPVGAWFQLFEDSAVFWHRSGTTPRRFAHRFYVREYGLLISSDDTAPPDAPTLLDFWKRKPEPEAKTEPKK
jgi:hypothetical protein